MADPYATRAPDLGELPGGEPAWLDGVRERGGALLEPGGPDRDGAAFVVVHCRGAGTLAPVARLEPAIAVLLAVEHAREGRPGLDARAMLTRLEAFDGPIYSVKQGWVGGPPDRPGCIEVDAATVLAVLDAEREGDVSWETDPDFGYEVPAVVAGLSEARARVLLPRLHYADNDRVYEHATLVAAKLAERAAIARSVPGIPASVLEATRWPAKPTAQSWKG